MKYRNRTLAFGFAVAALTALSVFLAGEEVVRRSVTDRVTERLHAEAAALADLIAPEAGTLFGDAPRPSPAADRLADTAGLNLSLRVTLVATNGVVVGDSAVPFDELAGLENHATRPEIEQARQGAIGSSQRHSVTIQDDLLYLARRIDRDGHALGYVRLALPVREIQRATGNYSLKLAGLSFLALVAVAGIGYLAAKSFSRPLETMSRQADAIAQGRRDLVVDYESDDEIGRLGAALNRMTAALSAQIEALSAEKRLRDTMLEGMTEGLVVVDAGRRVRLCSGALRAWLSPKGESPEGRTLVEVTREHAVLEAFDAALLRGERRREVIRLQGDSDVLFEMTVSPLADPQGNPAGAMGFFFDVTRLTALESVRREFVADVSHELRTPLTSIRSFVETLLAGGVDDPQNNRRFLEIIERHARRMEAIIDDLTDLSLMETGAMKLSLEPVALEPLVRDLLESMRPTAGSRGVSLASVVPAGTSVRADRRRLEQIFLNLLDNAIKFNRQGGSVTVGATPGDAGRTQVVVEDTGVGIPADLQEKVFHRFYRVDRSRSRQAGGTGLGLSIVKHLMRLHGGTVRIESRPGEGTRLVLEFPGG